MDDQTQQRLEILLSAAIGMGLSRLVAERFITDLVPEQRGLKDDVVSGSLLLVGIKAEPSTREHPLEQRP